MICRKMELLPNEFMNVPNKAHHRHFLQTPLSKIFYLIIETFKYAGLGTSKSLVACHRHQRNTMKC